MMPFFSIIIPVYNGDSTIRQALESIKEQTYKNYEVLIMDSLSTDGTSEIVESFVKSINSLRIFREKDSGVYDAMNKSLTHAHGEYLYFLGSDDIFFSNSVLLDASTELQSQNLPDFFYGNVLLGDTNQIHNGQYSLTKLYDLNICHQSIFYRKTIFNKGLRYDVRYPAFADWHLNFSVFADKTFRIAYSSVIVGRYALGGLSSRTSDPLTQTKRQVFLQIASRFYKDEYYRLKRHTFNTESVTSTLIVIWYHILYLIYKIVRKINKGIAKT